MALKAFLKTKPFKIISGGQTGVDRAALDWAMQHSVECGGWCPRYRKAEDGTINLKYPLKETLSEKYAQRTEWNALTSDATLIISPQPLTGGTLYTLEVLKLAEKPFFIVQEKLATPDAQAFERWFCKNETGVLNVAGPRESSAPGIYSKALEVLNQLFIQ